VVVKSAIVEKSCPMSNVFKANIPETAKDKVNLTLLDMGALIAGAKYKWIWGKIKNRIKELLVADATSIRLWRNSYVDLCAGVVQGAMGCHC